MSLLRFKFILILVSYQSRLATGVPDSFRGPKGVRLLLLCRGFFGYVGLIVFPL